MSGSWFTGTGRSGSAHDERLQHESFHRFPNSFGKSFLGITPFCINVGDQLSLPLGPITKKVYQPRGINVVQLLFKKHFQSSADQYEDKHALIYGRFRIKRITEVVEKFVLCGDYSQGVARIRCPNPDCKYEYFRPFSCKGFYFCPSCSKKRTLLFSEYMNERLLLALPHRQFVFTFPKLLRPYFRHNRRLFSEVSRMIFAIRQRF